MMKSDIMTYTVCIICVYHVYIYIYQILCYHMIKSDIATYSVIYTMDTDDATS